MFCFVFKNKLSFFLVLTFSFFFGTQCSENEIESIKPQVKTSEYDYNSKMYLPLRINNRWVYSDSLFALRKVTLWPPTYDSIFQISIDTMRILDTFRINGTLNYNLSKRGYVSNFLGGIYGIIFVRKDTIFNYKEYYNPNSPIPQTAFFLPSSDSINKVYFNNLNYDVKLVKEKIVLPSGIYNEHYLYSSGPYDSIHFVPHVGIIKRVRYFPDLRGGYSIIYSNLISTNIYK